MFNITTKHTSNASGRSQVIAKGHGKQRTVPVDLSQTAEFNHGSAVGALLAVLCDDRQQAMLRHPSGGQRVRSERTETSPGQFVTRWTIDV